MAEEAVTDIRDREEVKRAKRERAEDETRSNVKAEMKETEERKRKSREENAKAEAKTVGK